MYFLAKCASSVQETEKTLTFKISHESFIYNIVNEQASTSRLLKGVPYLFYVANYKMTQNAFTSRKATSDFYKQK